MKLTVQAAPIPSNFRGTPQQLLEAFLDRLEIVASELFPPEDVMPTSNQGIWLKNGKQIWVWDEDTSTYVPLDISASYTPQIFVGSAAPDAGVYTLWLKVDADNKVLGLYNYRGSTLGWVTEASELGPDTITEVMLQDDCVTRDKIKNGEVTSAKLANDLPLTKLARGTSRQIIQMKADASEPAWTSFFQASSEQVISTHTKIEVENVLGVTPQFVRPVLVCKENEHGWEAGDELDLDWAMEDDGSFSEGSTSYANASYVGVILGRLPQVHKVPSGDAPITPSKWKIKFYYAAG